MALSLLEQQHVMNILVCNDDGIDAPGIAALEACVSDLGNTWVVAPESEQSAKSHSLTMHEPLRASHRGARRFSVSGTPADCVYYAIHHALPERPALVVSGINNGSNLGNDVFYSGTVAAAMEACLAGIPAIAVSLHREPGEVERHWETAQHVARVLAQRVLAEGLPRRVLLNVNVPNVPLSRLRGIQPTVLGERRYSPLVSLRTDPRGREYFWIGGDHEEFIAVPDSDGPAVEAGYAAVTPIHPDLTHQAFLDTLHRWAT